MKAFRGTLVAAVLLALVVVLVKVLDPGVEAPEVVEEPPLFRFEKQELVRAEIERPDRSLVLAEREDGSWVVEGPGWTASRSMVNRVKHQIHDLNARATVIEDPEAPELYGLGQNAIEVDLTMRDGEQIRFLAGDPNPSNVSYYIQPLPGDRIYTVKKSALDYYSMEPHQFRERRFASFDSNDADRIEADLPGGRRLVLQRESAWQWWLEEPFRARASREEVRRLLGRVTALKAREFVEDHPEDLSRYGLEEPRARILVKFASRDPLDLRVGDPADPDDSGAGKPRSQAYMMLGEGDTVYLARDGLLQDFQVDPQDLRLQKFMRMRVGEVSDVVVHLRAEEKDDPEGRVTYLYRADEWLWENGSPVPGSTPSRLAHRAAEVRADTIVADEVGDPSRWGFDDPRLTVQLTTRDGAVRTLVVGDEAEPEIDPEGRERARYYARSDDSPIVYRVDRGVVDTAEDAIREWSRKARREADKAERHDRIREALGTLPEPAVSPAVPSTEGSDPAPSAAGE